MRLKIELYAQTPLRSKNLSTDSKKRKHFEGSILNPRDKVKQRPFRKFDKLI